MRRTWAAVQTDAARRALFEAGEAPSAHCSKKLSFTARPAFLGLRVRRGTLEMTAEEDYALIAAAMGVRP